MQIDDDDVAVIPPANAADAAVIPAANAAEGSAAAKIDANSFAAVNGVSDTHLDPDASHDATTKASCIKRILADPSINDNN